MRSPRSARRLRSRPPRHDRLEPLARFIDLTTAGEEHHFVVYVEGHQRPDDEHLVTGSPPLSPDVHPFDALAVFVAPPSRYPLGLPTVAPAAFLPYPTLIPPLYDSQWLSSTHGRVFPRSPTD